MRSLSRARLALALGAPGSGLVEFTPSLGASVGNVLTDADVGAKLRLGVGLSHPWDPRQWQQRRDMEIWLSAGARQQWVAHNMSLDGNTVGATRNVDRIPAVTEYEFGAGVRLRRLTVGYAATTRSREYRSGPLHHTYSSLKAGIDIAPF